MTARHVVVVGGGITGLAAAHRVLELAAARGERVSLTLLEADDRVGGAIATERRGEFLIEAGADSFISEKPWALELCRRLGLEDRMIGTRDEHRRAFVVRAGCLQPLPDGFLLLAPTRLWPLLTSRLFSASAKLRMAGDLILPRGREREDESLASFVNRRLGREVLERAAQPLVGGIYTADAERLSLAATMPRFLEMERRHRSVILAMRRQVAARDSGARYGLFLSFAGGMQTLVDALAARLPEGTLRVRTRATALEPVGSGRWRVALEEGTALDASAVILATPAFAAADLVRSFDEQLARALAAIPYASSATITLAYRRVDVAHPLDGFGFVVPAIEGRSCIACTFSSIKYAGRAPADALLLRVFCGGALGEELAKLPEDDLVQLARGELRALLGIDTTPQFSRVHRHIRAMPQYHLGHLTRLAAIEARVAAHRGLALAGNAYRGVGIPDCVRSGESAAAAVLDVDG